MFRRACALLLPLSLGLALGPSIRAQTWQQNANGQSATDPCGTPFVFPNNRNWSQQLVTAVCGQPPVSYTAQPSNWSTPQYPNSPQAIVNLNGPSVTLADVDVQFDTLTVAVPGGLHLDATGRLTGRNLTLVGDQLVVRENTQSGGKGDIYLTGGTLISKSIGTAQFDGVAGGGIALHLENMTIQVVPVSSFDPAGRLILPGRGSVRGLTLQVPAGGSVDLTGNGTGALWSGTVTGQGAGRVLMSREMRLDGDLTLQFAAGQGQWSGGSFVGTGVLRNAGSLTLSEAAPKNFVNLSVINSGTVEFALFGSSGTLGLTDGTELKNTGVLAIRSSSSLARVAGGSGAPPRLVNTGTLRKDGSDEAVLDPAIEFFNDRGTIFVEGWRLTIPTGFLLGGTYSVSSGNWLTLAGDNRVVGIADTLTGGGNSVRFAGGTLLARSKDPEGQDVPPPVLNFPNPTFQWSGGTFASEDGREITNAGTITAGGTAAVIATAFRNTGTIYLGGSLAIDAGLTFRNSGYFVCTGNPTEVAPASGGSGPVAVLENTGELSRIFGGTAIIRLPVVSSGFVFVDDYQSQSGALGFCHLEFRAGFTQTAGAMVLGRGGSIGSVGAPFVFTGGAIYGSAQAPRGAIVGNVEQRGPLVLGRSDGFRSGLLTIEGDFTQFGEPPLTVHVNGTADDLHGRLDVTGTATLAGPLTVNLAGGFQFRVGDVFTIFQAGAINGAFSSLTLPPGVSGELSVNGGTLALRITAAPAAASLVNVATRGRVETAEGTMIAGFVIGGTVPKKVIVRGIGPSLTNFGVAGALANPQLRLLDPATQTELASNDDWRSTQPQEITATGLAPTDPRESAIVTTLAPGSYTALLSGAGGEMGVGLVEVYDLERGSRAVSRAINVSTRARVLTESAVLIGGFVVEGARPRRVIVRALGPSLTTFGVSGALADPVLEVVDASGTTLATNDQWGSTQAAEIEATGFAPSNAAEAAVVLTLEPGAYTAIVRGASGGTGVGLFEVYDLE